jgi:hypothetical protein
MNPMFQPELPPVDLDFFTACQPSANKAWIGFEDERLQSTLGKMQRGAQSGDSAADNDYILVPLSLWERG